MKSTIASALAYVLCLISVCGADSPAAIDGNTLDYVVTGANGPYATSGLYRWFYSDAGGRYTLLALDSAAYTYGMFGYRRSSLSEGTITNYDAASGPNFSSLLSFDTASSGTFFYGNSGFPGYQQGTFVMYSGTAPASIASNVIEMTVTKGGAPFRSSGGYRIVTMDAYNYVIQELNGSVGSAQSYSYAVTNRTTGMLVFNQLDSASSGFADLTFSSATSGVFVMRDNNWFGYQSGTFTMTNLQKPTFVLQPVSQSAKVGTTVTLTARAAGTAPLTYQWYKNDAPISGATSTAYSIPNAQVSSSGNYRLLAQNLGGSTSSTTAVVTIYSCSYTLSSNAAAFPFYGGTGVVAVAATGGCSWTVSNTNTWITLTSPTTRMGSGSVAYSVAANYSNLPRSGALNIAGKVFMVAQGAEFAPTNIAGKSVLLKITGGSATVTNGTYIVSLGSGTNNAARLFPLSSATALTNTTYLFSKTAPKVGSLKFGASTCSLVFTNPVSGAFTLWTSGKTQTGQFALTTRGADFNADGRGDFAWQNTNDSLATWLMHGTTLIRSVPLSAGVRSAPGWKTVGAADFNRDGSSDVLFRTTNGAVALWLMNRTNWMSNFFLRGGVSPGTNWTAITAADFNNDNNADVLFQHTDGRLMLWLFQGLTFSNQLLVRNGVTPGTGWRATAATDLNSDGQTDIVFQHSSGIAAVWIMNGTAFVDSVAVRNNLNPGTGWRLIGASDLNLDFRNDFLWQKTDGVLQAWFMNGVSAGTSVSLFGGQARSYGLTCAAPK